MSTDVSTSSRREAAARAADRRPAITMLGRRALAMAALTYIAAWIVGLLVAPSAPSPDASDADVQAFFAAHRSATLVQAGLVHGVAALALAAFVVSLARRLAPERTGTGHALFLLAGLGAALVSLVQLGLEIALNRHIAGGGASSTTASLFHAVNGIDTAKLVLLGVSTAAATRLAARRQAFPAWISWLGYALLPILVTGGAAFIVSSDALSAVLAASLLLLLLWVAAVGAVVTRAPGQAAAAS